MDVDLILKFPDQVYVISKQTKMFNRVALQLGILR